jgi:hypothetical protein
VCVSLQARDGIISSTETSIEPDSCVFHDDDSGRIILVGAGKVRYVVHDFFLPHLTIYTVRGTLKKERSVSSLNENQFIFWRVSGISSLMSLCCHQC